MTVEHFVMGVDLAESYRLALADLLDVEVDLNTGRIVLEPVPTRFGDGTPGVLATWTGGRS